MASNRRANLLLALVGMALSGCSDRQMLTPDQREPADGGLFRILHTADPQAARQLLDGFYAPEGFGRWAGPKFSIMLAVPHSPSLQDPALLLKLFIPDSEMAQLKSLKLSASVNGAPLAPETFTAAGGQVYVRSLPAAVLSGDRLRADFMLDKWMPGSAQDQRNLGIVVTVAGLKNGLSSDL